MNNNLLTICSSCQKIKVNEKWIGKENPIYKSEIDSAEHFTDGYCPSCVEFYRQQIIKRREIIAHGI